MRVNSVKERLYINMKIVIEYDGAYPNLCTGQLFATVDGTRYEFPRNCLSSGGSVYADTEWNWTIDSGDWSVTEWPKNMPDSIKQAVEDAVNADIPRGCCGGCV